MAGPSDRIKLETMKVLEPAGPVLQHIRNDNTLKMQAESREQRISYEIAQHARQLHTRRSSMRMRARTSWCSASWHLQQLLVCSDAGDVLICQSHQCSKALKAALLRGPGVKTRVVFCLLDLPFPPMQQSDPSSLAEGSWCLICTGFLPP